MHQNRARALDELKRRLYQKQYEDQLAKSQQNRKMQIGSSSRSERIRTYNFIQDRITDHRLGENFTGIQRFLTAITLPVVIDNLKAMHQLELFDELVVENSQTKA
jgi:peptide chain release factor 1